MTDTPSRKPEKQPHEMTTEEAMAALFPPEVVTHLKEQAAEASRKGVPFDFPPDSLPPLQPTS